MQQPSSKFARFQEQGIPVGLTVLALVVAGLLLAGYAVAAWNWQQQPFVGFLITRDLVISGEKSLTGETWTGFENGLLPGDRLIKLDTAPLGDLPPDERFEAFERTLDRHEAGDMVELRIERDDTISTDTPRDASCLPSPEDPGLRLCALTLRLEKMPSGDVAGYAGVGLITGMVLWLMAVGLLVRRSSQPVIRYIVGISAMLAIMVAGRFDTVTTHEYVWAWMLAAVIAGALSVTFSLIFPYDFAFLVRTPVLRMAPLVVGTVLGAVGIAFYQSSNSGLNAAAPIYANLMFVLGILILGGVMAWRRSRSASPVVRNQATLVVIGLLPALLPTLLMYGWWLISGDMLFSLLPLAHVLMVLFPLSVAYAAFQFRLLDTDRMITQSVLYGVLLGFLMIGYWLVVTGIAMFIGRTTSETVLNPLLIAFSIFLVAIIFAPLRSFLQRQIDAAYFRARRTYQLYLERFTREVTNAVSLNDVVMLLQRYLNETLAPTHVILYVRDIVTYEYRPEPDPVSKQPMSDIVFSADSGLVRHLRDRASLLYLEEGRPLPLDVVSDRARLAVLGAPVIVRLKGQRTLNGFIVIGPRRGGAPYLHEDLRFMESLSDQIALAVERAQVVDDLERRVRVQDVLSQVSRALNFAIDFDTLLELVYAQTSRVINAPNFYIALRDPNTDELYYVFYNEGDERVTHKEGQRWRVGRDLMSEIARTQQTLRTDDYVRESLARDPRVPPENPNLKAWMGVPLMADTGGGVLGVMVAATTEPGVIFTDDQQDLFWDIANLAASAIDKLQLFDKTQQRARQLSAINTIASQLASEMGDVDKLLRLITENAVQILGAEAGSLLLVEEESGDLEFHVVVGGSGEDLIGTRMPAGSGLAGATVQRGKSIIVNDPTRDSRWYGEMRPVEGGGNGDGQVSDGGGDDFQSNAILSVPLIVHNRAIGVLQTINKRDGSIFVQEDADLLETFAGQAAIAIENARLFDMTDQQLALRVQELDTMQRIDQELNRTLNLNNVVDITMDWALRKSGAAAGALFILDRERHELRIVASYGYPTDSPFGMQGDQDFPAERGVLGRVVRSGQPSLITNVSIDPEYTETLPHCVAQLIVPLFSANQVIGVIILESDQDGELDLLDLDFVARLAEHASPAIVNAQLFSELQHANLARAEFVSMVAHELRNPMTSMKGYTDLLLKGVVGPVNEQQSDFLTTIYSNVARMETLVSDLNDLTKQQTNNLRLEIFPVDFRNVVMETLRALQRQIEDKNQELSLLVPENLPLVMGDQNRLIQIMTNFISNAYKYTPPGGRITITASATRNVWDPQGAQQVIHCSVKDTGIGMSDEDLGQLFIPYFRSENPKTREQPGTGLGMTITRGLIEQHGGRVWVESRVEVGTTFHFTIPVATEQVQAGV